MLDSPSISHCKSYTREIPNIYNGEVHNYLENKNKDNKVFSFSVETRDEWWFLPSTNDTNIKAYLYEACALVSSNSIPYCTYLSKVDRPTFKNGVMYVYNGGNNIN